MQFSTRENTFFFGDLTVFPSAIVLIADLVVLLLLEKVSFFCVTDLVLQGPYSALHHLQGS